MASSVYEPSPRLNHSSIQVEDHAYHWGGLTQDSSGSEVINIFDCYSESWKEHSSTRIPPPGLQSGGFTLLCDDLYYFGGYDGKKFHNSLHRLQTRTLEWEGIKQANPAGGPLPKAGCGMVAYQQQLALIGGVCSAPTGPLRSGAEFIKSSRLTGYGWTNEFHLFSIKEGKWSSPPTTGPRPPPCANFTFTAINEQQAVYFGGAQPPHGRVNDVYIIDFSTMEWTKLEKPHGAPWPVGRSTHAACCLNRGDDEPILLMTGGVDGHGNTLKDAWLLEVNSGRWKELTLPEGTLPVRWGHTLTSCRMVKRRTHVTTFGGGSKYYPGIKDSDIPKLADTTVLEFESVQSGDTPSSRQWELVGVADSSQLGTPERTKYLEKLKQKKIDHERERNTQRLQEEVLQMEEKVAMAQRQARLALARAVSAEIKADQVPVLQEQLSDTKATLEEQNHRQDEARVAAQQQFDQMKTALEHQIRVRDQTNTALQQTHRQMKANLEHQIELKEQARVSTRQQFHQMKSTLEHQLREKEHQLQENEQVRVTLEAQIQAKDHEKGKLQRQLYMKDEHIRALQKSHSRQHLAVAQSQEKEVPVPGLSQELTKPSQVHSSRGTSDTHVHANRNTEIEVAEVQKVSGDGQVIPQEVPIAPQLKEHRKEVGTREEELTQATVKLQLELESKNLEVTFLRCDAKEKDDEIAAIKRHREEESKALQSQVDSLQQDLGNLQQRLTEKDNETAAIIIDSQCNKDRIKTLELEKQELTNKMESLEAKCKEVKFFRDTYSWEVDQLRDDLMDKEVEIDLLRKQQVHILPTSSSSSSSPVEHFRGAEVVAQTTFNITQESQSLQFKGYGFKLHVPEGSLPAGVSETKLKVQVSLSGQFQMPPDCELLSAVYWVHSPHRFTKPLTVEIQHCAVLSNDQQSPELSFVSTKCTQKELPYVFKLRDGGIFSPHSSYGGLALTQFSGFGIIRKLRRSHRIQPDHSLPVQTIHVQPKQLVSTDSELPKVSTQSEGDTGGLEDDKQNFDQYCGQVYTCKGINDCRVHFVITKNLDPHRTVVEKFYSTKFHIREDIEMSLGFNGEMIELSIPRRGVILQSGWKIKPRYDPIIRKGNVDHFSCGLMIPRCELLLRWPHAGKPHACLEHEINLIGAKGCSFFTLYIPDAAVGIPTPSPVVPSPSSESSLPTGARPNEFSSEITAEMSVLDETKTLGIENLADITTYLHSLGRTSVFNLGLILGLDYNRLKPLIDSPDFLVDMLAGWLQRVNQVQKAGVPTWKRLVEALRDPRVGQNGIASNIEWDQL